jgi:HEAT repeat protein
VVRLTVAVVLCGLATGLVLLPRERGERTEARNTLSAPGKCVPTAHPSRASASSAPDPELTRRAREGEPKDARTALKELEKLGPAAAYAVPDLMAILRDEESHLWCEAMAVLAAIGPGAREAAPLLAEILLNFERAREDSGPGFYKPISQYAVAALVAIGPDSLPHLLALAREPVWAARYHAVAALGQLGEPARGAALEESRSPDPLARASAAGVLGTLRSDFTRVVELLADSHDEVHDAAVLALPAFGEKAVPHLVQALHQGRSTYFVTESLIELGPKAAAAAPAVEAALRSSADGLVVDWLVRVLGAIGPEAAQASEPIARLLDHESDYTREYAHEALVNIGKASAPALLQVLAHGSPRARALAADALGRIGEGGDERYLDLLGSEDFALRLAAAQTLARRGRHAERVLSILQEGLLACDVNQVMFSAEALPGLGREATPALPALFSAVEKLANRFRDGERFGIGSDSLFGSLRDAMREVSRHDRETLRQALDHRDDWVRSYVKKAIERLDKR